MNRPIQLFIKRNIWLILVAIFVLAIMTLRFHASRRRSMSEVYQQLNLEDSPFEMIQPLLESFHPSSEKKLHVAFLKVHKTGSTTAQNIFLRFGWNNNLTFVLPPNTNAFYYPNIISLRESMTVNNTLAPPQGKHYEMLCNHVIYERSTFRKYMPNDTFYVGSLREPYEFFKSALNYLRPGYLYNKIKTDIPASDFLKDPLKYEPKTALSSFTNNRMAVEFGCPDDIIRSGDKAKILQFVSDIDKDFGLVTIAEHFEESIVLLRRYLKWSTKDILYLDKNVGKYKNEIKLVGPYDRQLYKRWARIDYVLYEHFYRKLREQVRAEGYDFDDELLYFAEVRKMAGEFCSDVKNTVAKLTVQKSKWSERFDISHDDCILLRKSEIPFVQDIRFRQYGSREI